MQLAGHDPQPPLRLGFPVKVMGWPGLNSPDTRRHAQNPHLTCSLEHLHGVLDYLTEHRIDMYRFASDLAPYATHPDLPRFHGQLAESQAELAAFGERAGGGRGCGCPSTPRNTSC